MMQELIENSQSESVYGITNVEHVKHMFDELALTPIDKNFIDKSILEKIEAL